MWWQEKLQSKLGMEINLLEDLHGWQVLPLDTKVEILLCFWLSTRPTT